MTLWHRGEPLKFNKKIDDFFITELIRPKMKYLLCVFLSEGKYYYSLRYWKGAETPWTPPKLIDNEEFLKKVLAFISNRDKYPQAFVQEDDFTIQPFWINADDLEEVQDIESRPWLFGSSWRRILSAELGLVKPVPLSLRDYEQTIIDNGLDFIREDIVDVELYGDFIIGHIERMKAGGVKRIEFTLKNYNAPHFGNPDKSIPFLKPYADIVKCEAHNEFIEVDNISETIDIVIDIKNASMESIAGAWGNSHHGRDNSVAFLGSCLPDTISMHRPYPPPSEFLSWLDYLKDFGKDVSWNEVLPIEDVPSGLTDDEIREYVRIGKDKGIRYFNTFGNKFELMGGLKRELCP